MNFKGQGALEYLLLIGGAVLIAAVVLTMLSGIADSSDPNKQINIADCAKFGESFCGQAAYGSGNCTWAPTSTDTTLNKTSGCVPCTDTAAAAGECTMPTE